MRGRGLESPGLRIEVSGGLGVTCQRKCIRFASRNTSRTFSGFTLEVFLLVFEVEGLRAGVLGLGFWIQGFGFWVSGLGFRISGLGFGV